MQLREYAGPIRVLAAAVIGFSLLCSASALAMNDLNSQDRNGVQPLNIVDLVVENMNTSVALTQQAVSAFIPTQTVVPTDVPTDPPSFTATPLPSDTIAAVFSSPTPRQLTPTRRPRSSGVNGLLPTRTNTPRPTATRTPIPNTKTNTPLPPTNTPLPPPTQPPPTQPPPTQPPPTQPPPTQPPPTQPPPTQPPPTQPPPTQPPPTQPPPTTDPPNIQNSDATQTASP